MDAFDKRVNEIGRRKAIEFFVPRLIIIGVVIGIVCAIGACQ